ncbi:MAG: NAD(+) synthase [Candidatus Heimdallarchaeota archaeon]|nr:MAG: NAD(+) synthase [Candidatus Heimdallarchaeota archaeon]
MSEFDELDISKDVATVSEKIIHFIETLKEERGVEGVLILFSGYMDSTVVSKLSLEAVGEEAVKLLIRTNKYFDKQEDMLEMSLDFLGVSEENVVKCDIEPMLKKFGARDLLPGSVREIPSLYQPLSYSLLRNTAKKEIEENTYGMVGTASSEREKWIHKIIAHNKLRSRLQMAIAYYTAEQENRFLVGTINKTELSTGLFTKWGHGHCGDVMPLGNLYRSQILQLAEYLNLPESIRTLTKADLMPGVENKYQYFFGVPAFNVDKILVCLEHGLPLNEIADKTGLPIEIIEKINTYYNSAAYTRQAPLIPKV